ncbi:MAG TPA: TonB-dependent receptor [Opitutaceae bacterium]|nr:TonB-dependent receptor [Opitutaceae bacterium]
MKYTTTQRTAIALLSTLALLPDYGFAQAKTDPAAPTNKTGAADQETVVLSPFEVSTTKDKGYRATNSTSGTRLDTPIKELPLNLEVITDEFIRDTGATNLREALRYSAGVVLDSQSDAFVEPDSDRQSAGANDPRGATRAPGDSTTKLRGFVIDQVLRDGFRRQYSADSINIDRVEVLRGPSALLYGVGSFGGVINYLPKKPLLTPKYHTAVSVGTQGLLRGEFDFTGPLGNGPWKLAYRLTGAYEEEGDYTDFYNSKHWTVSPVFSFSPFKNTTVVIDNEFGHVNQTGVGFQNIRAGGGLARAASWLTDVAPGAVNPRTFRWSGPDTYLKGPFRNSVIDVTQKITDDFFLKAGVTQSRREFDSRQIRDTGTVNQPFATNNPANYRPDATISIGGTNYNLRDALTQAVHDGKFPNTTAGLTPLQIYQNRAPGSFRGDSLYGFVANTSVNNDFLLEEGAIPTIPTTNTTSALRYDWIDDDKVENRFQARTDATYKLDLGKWGKHDFVVGLQYQKQDLKEYYYGPQYSYTNHGVADIDRYSYRNPGDFSYFKYGIQGDGRPDSPRLKLNHYQTLTWDLGYYAVYQGKFFNDRLTLIGGARRDRNDQWGITYYDYEAGRAPDIAARVGNKAPTATSPQVGVSFAINKSLSVFALYSTGVVPNYYATDGNGAPFAPTKAKNKEIGLKFDLFDGRISGTVSAYKIERTNTPKYLWWAPSPYTSLKNGWTANATQRTLWANPNAEAVWYGIQKVGLDAAKKIFPSGFWSTLDAMAAIPAGANQYTPGAGFSSIPGVARWWDSSIDSTTGLRGLQREADYNTFTARQTGNNGIYHPLVNLDDPQVLAFLTAAKIDYTGWGGNFSYTPGQTYYYGDGTADTGNAATGSGASVPLDDQAKGWDVSIIANITRDLTATFNFAHVQREITSPTYKFVDAPFFAFGNWYVRDGNFGTLSYNKSASQVYTDVKDTTTYHAAIPEYQQAADDTPANTATTWIRYSFDHTIPALKGLSVGVGGEWKDRRMWFTGFAGGGGNIQRVTLPGDPEPVLVQLWTKRQLTVNAMIDYKAVYMDRYHVRYAFNISNLLDDQHRYGYVYGTGRSMKFSVGVDF